jgi:hypothetical protein
MTIPASRKQRAKRGQKTAKTGDSADTLADHLIGEGLEKPEIAGFAVSCVHPCAAPRLTFPSPPPNMCTQCPRPPNP